MALGSYASNGVENGEIIEKVAASKNSASLETGKPGHGQPTPLGGLTLGRFKRGAQWRRNKTLRRGFFSERPGFFSRTNGINGETIRVFC